ncbi:mechanosensitive ion channel family protein [Egicoccus sp. AB-alg6-2]|uniref:mechanosensitive ion channel family protein n=1 Tax=Egicoccus sp. AB-alg6-2 TaxID=3242692 RepID=UPI00359D13BB
MEDGTPEDEGGGETVILEDVDPPGSWDELVELLSDSLQALAEGFVARLPLIALALVLFFAGLLLVRWVLRGVERALQSRRADRTVQGLAIQLARVVLVLLVTLYALSVAGVQIGAVLAGLGLAGLALAFALQNILENFVAGVLILIRKPFRRGDQIESNEFMGTVEDIDLRVTRIRDFDDQVVLIPNAMVFTEPIVNLTRLGRRRTRITIGVDYRDDHDRAREVLLEAVRGVEGVLPVPEPEVLCTELGDSSVDFEVSFWSRPQMKEVRFARDRVLRACKSAVEAEGMTIPWPIRTLEWGRSTEPPE